MAQGKGRRGVSNQGMREVENTEQQPKGSGNQSPWSGEPWANHGEPDDAKSGKCPELQDGREVSAGVRVDPEVPRSMA